jgi:hypothetical protein
MSSKSIEYYDEENRPRSCTISGAPDTCPICGCKVDPVFRHAFMRRSMADRVLEVVFKCPSEDCDHLFIAYYYPGARGVSGSNYFVLNMSRLPLKIEYSKFSEIINRISKQFPRIYNDAKLAEENGLGEVCGPGYRRALEFLVKDYLIAQFPNEEEKIKSMWLKNAIDRINNENIKTCAERAAWLGNDETHYVRVWADKDIANLKDLIDLAVGWIESEEKTKKYKKEMMK